MEIILEQDVYNCGKKHDVVAVKTGYAKNFLIPKKMARFASEEELVKHAKRKEENAEEIKKDLEKANILCEKIAELGLISTESNAAEDGKLFGSITERDIANMLETHEIKIHYKNVILKGAIKSIGDYEVELYLGHNIKAKLTLQVVRHK